MILLAVGAILPRKAKTVIVWQNITGMAYCQHRMAVGVKRLIPQDGPRHFFDGGFDHGIVAERFLSDSCFISEAICGSCSCRDGLVFLYFHFIFHVI